MSLRRTHEHEPLDAARLGSLPEALAEVLERRYLAGYDASRWLLQPADAETNVPVLCEVVALGRPAGEFDFARAMPRILASLNDPGHDLVMVLSGEGERHRLYFGLRRRPGSGSLASALDGMKCAFRAQIPGLGFGPPADMAPEGHDTLSGFLESVAHIATLTGIPSARGGALPAAQQRLERVTAAMGARRYVVMIVAEPVPIERIEASMASCRRLIEGIHPLINSTVSRSENTGLTVTEQFSRPLNAGAERIAPEVLQLLAFARDLGTVGKAAATAASIIGGVAPPQGSRSESRARADGRSQSQTVNLLDADARYCSELLSGQHHRLAGARGTGWWRTAVYIGADEEETLRALGMVMRSIGAGDATALEPLRMQRHEEHALREAMQHGAVLTMRPVVGHQVHPLGEPYQGLSTCLSSDELAVIAHLPQQDIPGLSLHDRGDFALSVPAAGPQSVRLGYLRDAGGNGLGPVDLSAQALNEHVMVIGTPGSGKTNTCMRLLTELTERLEIPFLVIEPVKGEYRRLAAHPALRGRLRVYTVGGGDGLPLRINPLQPVPGSPLLGHIDLLKAVFNASFAMYPGMPQVLEQALIEVFEDRGWNLYQGHNSAVRHRHAEHDTELLTPCLADLYQQVELVLKRRGYGQEVHLNMGAALRSRLGSLMVGNKGLVLNTRHSTPLRELFDEPAVVDLQYLRDDEDKSFLMALLLALLSQYCEARQAGRHSSAQEQLQHVTLIEEAHRLLAATRQANAESADARGKGVSMYTDMLAELRAKGEGFMIAEQIPTKLAPDVLKNTNLKIIHKLTAPTDRAALGEGVNLSEAQRLHLATLPKGVAVVHGLAADAGDSVAHAVLVNVTPLKDALRGRPLDLRPSALVEKMRSSLYRVGGCASCSSPCSFYPEIERQLRQVRPRPAFAWLAKAVLDQDLARSWAAWQAWQSGVIVDGMEPGHLHCAFVHDADQWLRTVLTARGEHGVDQVPVVRPKDILLADQLGAAFGAYAAAVLGARTDAAQDAHDRAVVQLQEALSRDLNDASAAPRLAGCKNCPARCRMLPWVATVDLGRVGAAVAGVLPRQVVDAFGNPGALQGRWLALERALDAVADVRYPDPPRSSAWKGAFRYCLLTQVPLPTEVQAVREEALERICQAQGDAERGPPSLAAALAARAP